MSTLGACEKPRASEAFAADMGHWLFQLLKVLTFWYKYHSLRDHCVCEVTPIRVIHSYADVVRGNFVMPSDFSAYLEEFFQLVGGW